MPRELYGDDNFFIYMLKIDILRNSSSKLLSVLRGAFEGFGCPKRHQDALLAMSMQPGVTLIRNHTPFQRSGDSSIQDGKLLFGNVNNTIFNDRIQFLQGLKLRHTSMHIQVNAYRCYYLSNWVRNDVAMSESLILPLVHIRACVDVDTISSIAKNYS